MPRKVSLIELYVDQNLGTVLLSDGVTSASITPHRDTRPGFLGREPQYRHSLRGLDRQFGRRGICLG